MAIEIVDFPIKNGDFPLQTVSSPEGINYNGFVVTSESNCNQIIIVKIYPSIQFFVVTFG